MMIVLVASGVQYGTTSYGVEAQGMTPTTIRLVTNIRAGTQTTGNAFRTIGNVYSFPATSTVTAAGRQVAQGFTTGANASGHTITEVKARLYSDPLVPYSPVVALHSEDPDNAGFPSDTVLATFGSGPPLTLSSSTTVFPSVTFTLTGGYAVAPSTVYYLVFSDAVASATTVQNYLIRQTNDNTQSGRTGWSIGNAGVYKADTAASWTSIPSPDTDQANVISVRGYATASGNFVSNLVVGDKDGIGPAGVGNLPDSTTNPMTVANAGQESANGFTTGGGPSVYTITEVRAELFQIRSGSTTYPFSPVLTLHADESGDAADGVLHTFTNPNPIPASAPNTYVEWTSRRRATTDIRSIQIRPITLSSQMRLRPPLISSFIS